MSRGNARRNLSSVPEEFRDANINAQLAERRKGILLSEVEEEQIEWLWEGRIALGKITVLDGDPGLGKSAFTTDLAARVSVGRDFPDDTPCSKGGVVLLNAEDGLADTIRPRLDAVGGDPSRVLALAEVPDERNPKHDRVLSLPEDIWILEQGIERVDAKLVVIDPLMAFLGGDSNAHKDQDIRRAMAPLKSMAERTGVAVVLVRHLNKGGSGNPLYRGGGSIGIIGAARTGLIVAQDPNDPEEKRRILAPSKNNLAVMSNSVIFQVVNAHNGAARVEWLGESDMSARDLVKTPMDDEEKSAMDSAVDFLREEIGDGTRAVKAIKKSANDAGISWRTLERAKSHLKVVSEKQADNSWGWSLPDKNVKANTANDSARGGTPPTFGGLGGLPSKSGDLQEKEDRQTGSANGGPEPEVKRSGPPKLTPDGGLQSPANEGFSGQGRQDRQVDGGKMVGGLDPERVNALYEHPDDCSCWLCREEE